MLSQIGYCTNVHAGEDWARTRENLERHALEVKRLFAPHSAMGVGLWLSANSARQLVASEGVAEFAQWLAQSGLVPYTLNGFPYGDFHQAVVKHRVYEPTWWQDQRREYTLELAAILDQLLPPGQEGSISTLPIAWGDPVPAPERLHAAAENLRRVAAALAKLERERGRLIHLCLEPEPGCYLQRSGDVPNFFEDYLLPGSDEAIVRRHLRVCHDVCHAGVMFETQDDVLAAYHRAGIHVGKVQVSAAVRVPWERIDPRERAAALDQLRGFAEDRYLHQTVVRAGERPAGERQTGSPSPVFFEDLPLAIADHESRPELLSGEWRVHFHVPIYVERFGYLETTQPEIDECLRAARRFPELEHFEVETYAWGVLPSELRQPSLATGIARELAWFEQLRSRRGAGG